MSTAVVSDSIHKVELVIGLTGAIGAGCTKGAEFLETARNYRKVELSTPLKEDFRDRGIDNPTRDQLQELGNEWRKERGAEFLVSKALSNSSDQRIALSGIRNPAEVEYLRQTYGSRFTLVGILAPAEERWQRVSVEEYRSAEESEFIKNDKRDNKESFSYGQGVAHCVSKADILIYNSRISLEKYKEKICDSADLISGDRRRNPSEHEVFMHMAYATSHSSQCISRKVGAVITDSDRRVVGVGYNENPAGTKPCEEAYGDCFRDLEKKKYLTTALRKNGAQCPACNTPLPERLEDGPASWRCLNVNCRVSLDELFFNDRGASWCTAIHAELRAILAAGERAKNGSLYCTTLPCFQCAEQLIHVGVKHVWYTEPYPSPMTQDRLDLAGVDAQQFEGVRSTSFERFFPTKLK